MMNTKWYCARAPKRFPRDKKSLRTQTQKESNVLALCLMEKSKSFMENAKALMGNQTFYGEISSHF